MPDASYTQSSFLGGEWSPFYQGRTDSPDYRKSMKQCLNAYPLEEACVVRRPGAKFIATTRNGAPGRLISFDFQENAPYQLEFTDAHMRAFNGVTGVNGLVTDLSYIVSSVTTDNPMKVNTAIPHALSTGDQIQFGFDGGSPSNNLDLLQNRQFVITVTGASQFTIADPITNAGIDGSLVTYLPGPVVIVQRIFDFATPYVSGNWSNIRLVQVSTEALVGAVLLTKTIYPVLLSVLTPPSVGVNATFNLNNLAFTDGPYLDPFIIDGAAATSKATPSATTGSITFTITGAPTNTWSGFKANDIGRQVRMFSEPPDYDPGHTYAVGDPVLFNGLYYSCVQVGTGEQPDIQPGFWAISTSLAFWTWGTITAYTSPTVVTVLIAGRDLAYTTAMNVWRLGVYGGDNGFPTCGVYHEGRLWLSGAVPNRFDASTSNPFNNGAVIFSPTLDSGQVVDNSAISYTVNASDNNALFWMVSSTDGIICGTQAGEWLIFASQTNQALTPTNVQAHRGTRYGCANIEPRLTGSTIVFVQRYGRKLIEYFSDVFSGRKSAVNLSERAAHLTIPKVLEIAYQRERTPIVWARCADGSLIGMTYKRETLMSSQPPAFFGWHKHALGSGRLVESVSAGPSINGELDTLSMVTNDPVTNIRHVEALTDLFEVDTPITSAWFCDDAVCPSANGSRGARLLTTNGQSEVVFYGLWHLNGQTVSVFACGDDVGDYTVINGRISVPVQTGPDDLFTLAQFKTLTDTLTETIGFNTVVDDINGNILYTIPVVIGFTYDTQGQVLRPGLQQEAGSANGPALGKSRRTHMFAALLEGTQKISFGTDFTRMRPAIFRSDGGRLYADNTLYSGVYWNTIEDGYSFDSELCWEVSRPYPATVCMIGAFLHTQDR